MAARGHGSVATAARRDVATGGGDGGTGTARDGGAAVAERGGQVSVGGPGPPHGAVPPLTVCPPLTAFSVPPVSPHGLCLHSPDGAAAERAPRIYTRTGDSGRAREAPEAAGRALPRP